MPMLSTPSGIVVGVDGSESSLAAVRWAARDAQMRKVDLRLVHVVTPVSHTTSSPWAGVPAPADNSRLKLERYASRRVTESARRTAFDEVSPDFRHRIQSDVLTGSVVSTLTDYAEHADMLVVGRRGRNPLARAVFGSTSSGVVQHARCPVAVIHDDESPVARSPMAPVVVGIDGTPASEPATAVAFDEASRRGVDLIALHAWNDEGPLHFGRPGHAPIEFAESRAHEEQILAERLAGWRSRYPDVPVHEVVVTDRPVPRLLEQAEAAQLLVLGGHSHGRLARMLLGSVSSAVVTAAHVPVIIAHAA